MGSEVAVHFTVGRQEAGNKKGILRNCNIKARDNAEMSLVVSQHSDIIAAGGMGVGVLGFEQAHISVRACLL